MKGKPNLTGLFQALRSQIREDSSDYRKKLFSAYLQHRSLLRIAYSLVVRGPAILRVMLASLYGALWGAQPFHIQEGESWVLVKKGNELRQLSILEKSLTRFRFQQILWQVSFSQLLFSSNFFCSQLWEHLPQTKKLLKLVARLERHLPFFALLRATQMLCTYIYLSQRLREQPPRAILTSTFSNPHGSAGIAVASRWGLPLIYCAHGALTSAPARLHCDLGLFHGAQTLTDFLSQASHIGDHLFYPQYAEPSASEATELMICLSKDINLQVLKECLSYVRAQAPDLKIAIRPHPHSFLTTPQLKSYFPEGLRFSEEENLADSLGEAAVVLAGNSTVHLEALAQSVPSIYLSSLDHTEDYPLSFVAKGLVRPLNFSRDLLGQIHEEQARMHESHWQKELRAYIHSDENAAQFFESFENHLAELVNG